MSTFAEIAARTRSHEKHQVAGHINYCGLIAELAEAMDTFEHNTARIFAVFNIAGMSHTPLEQLRQQIRERTAFVLEDLRKDVP